MLCPTAVSDSVRAPFCCWVPSVPCPTFLIGADPSFWPRCSCRVALSQGQTVDDIPKEVLIDCAHLVKANSIQGCKMNNVNVVYTPWTNLKKTADMDVGQIGFHRQKDVKMLTVEKKVNEILNRLEKTKVERFPDLAAEKEARDREERNEKKAQIQEMKRKEKEEMKKKKELEELRSYSSLMKAENMSSNQDGNDSDDFM
uniref:Coiled-coil domain-containing protein 25 n=1 Tax=Nothoprocta perdicaria TaxID=30464 RepID=A0A8C6Z7X3_NOTPE